MNTEEIEKEIVVTSVDGVPAWSICAWDLKSGSVKKSYTGNSCGKRTACIIASEYLISADSCKPLIHIWPLNKREHCMRIPCSGVVTALDVTDDGMYCAAAVACKIRVWQISTGDLMAILEKHITSVSCIRFAGNFRFLITADSRMVYTWPLAKVLSGNSNSGSGGIEPLYAWSHGGLVTDVKCSSSAVVTGSTDKTVKLWDLSNGRLSRLVVLDCQVTALEWDLQQQVYAGTDAGDIYHINLSVTEIDPEKFIKSKQGSKIENTKQRNLMSITCLSLSNNTQILVSGSLGGKIQLWNTINRTFIRFINLDSGGSSTGITNCFVVKMPLEFNKPSFAIAPFKQHQEEEKDGRVAIKLQSKLYVDYLDSLPLRDSDVQQLFNKDFTSLDKFGEGGNEEKFKEIWNRLCNQVLFGLHDTLDQLYAQLETGLEMHQRPAAAGLIKLKLISLDKPEEQIALLGARFEEFCVQLVNLMSMGYTMTVNFPVKHVLDLVHRTVAVTPPFLLSRPTVQRNHLSKVVPALHLAAINVLQAMLVSVKSALLPFVDFINQMLVQILRWTQSKTNEYSSLSNSYSELRCLVFEVLWTLIRYGLSGDSKSYESFFNEIIRNAVTDARPQLDVTLILKSDDLKDVENRKKRSTNSLSNLSKQSFLKNQKLCINAFKVFEQIVLAEGKALPEDGCNVISNLLSNSYKKLTSDFINNSACRLSFYNLLNAVSLTNRDSFPIGLAHHMFSSGLQDSNAQVYESCRRGLAVCGLQLPLIRRDELQIHQSSSFKRKHEDELRNNDEYNIRKFTLSGKKEKLDAKPDDGKTSNEVGDVSRVSRKVDKMVDNEEEMMSIVPAIVIDEWVSETTINASSLSVNVVHSDDDDDDDDKINVHSDVVSRGDVSDVISKDDHMNVVHSDVQLNLHDDDVDDNDEVSQMLKSFVNSDPDML